MTVIVNEGEQPAGEKSPTNFPDAGKLFPGLAARMVGIGLDLFITVLLGRGLQDFVLEPIGLDTVDHRFVTLSILFMYCALFWASPLRATPAQLLLRMRVLDEKGEKLQPGRALLRSALLIGLLIAVLTLFKTGSNPWYVGVALVGYAVVLLAAVTPGRQAGHDLLVHSLVIKNSALKSSVLLSQLREFVFDRTPASSKRLRPSVLKVVGDLLVLGVPVILLLTGSQISNDRDLRSRTGYAIGQVADLKTAVRIFYQEYNYLPSQDSDLQAATSGHYPDGGYYQLEDGGVIRIRFTVKSELIQGSIVLAAQPEKGGFDWQCGSEGGFAKQYLHAWCRN